MSNSPMPGYQVKSEVISIGLFDYKIRSLKDRQQFSDPEGLAESMGISSANWSLFGVVWPSGIILAEIMNDFPIEELRILEIGCGIALASMVLSLRGANITASDYHPLTQSFLDKNTAQNLLPDVKYISGDWRYPISSNGKFDLIIGSDLLYERGHPAQLAQFIDSHTTSTAQVIIIDPKRRQKGKFLKTMSGLGFSYHEEKPSSLLTKDLDYKGNILTLKRGQHA